MPSQIEWFPYTNNYKMTGEYYANQHNILEFEFYVKIMLLNSM